VNVIVICLDTLRWDALGCYGSTWVRTPWIDRFARFATRFDRAFCGSFPTVPMRVDACTGAVNWPRYGWKAPDADQTTLPQVLRENGWYTALVLDTINNVYVGLHKLYDEYHLIDKDVDDGVTADDIEVPWPRENARQNSAGFIRDRVRTSHYRHEPDWFVARTMLRACEWLEDNRKRDKFFLWVDTFEIHEDWRAPDYLTELYSPHYSGIDYSYPNYGAASMYSPAELERLRARYAAEVTLTDRWVGLLLRTVEEMGLLHNTMLVLWSDHGMYLGEHGLVGKHTVDVWNPWPLYDAVARIPLLVSVPGGRAVRTTRALVQPADLFASVLEFYGISGPETTSRSWLPVLVGGSRSPRTRIFSSCHSWNGPGRIDYLPSLITVNTPRWCLSVGPSDCPVSLFSRKDDPGQRWNQAERHPEVVQRLRRDLARFMAENGAAPGYIETFALGRAPLTAAPFPAFQADVRSSQR